MPLFAQENIAAYGKTVELEREPRGTLLDSVLSQRSYVSVEDRIALESVLDATDRYQAMAAERVRQIEKNLAWGKAERERITALDVEAERERVARVTAEEKERKRVRRNALQRARRSRQRQYCVCGKPRSRCNVGPFQTVEEMESEDISF